MRFARNILVCSILVLLVVYAPGSDAQTPDEVIEIPSLTLSDDQFLQGDIARGTVVTVTGKLQVPTIDARLPVVILLHGSGGPTSSGPWSWANFLEPLGVATLRIDSYTARGYSEIYTDQSRVGEFNPIYDVYRAVDVLVADPRLDANRIAIMGFSRGGLVALYASLNRFHDLYGPKRGDIAAYLPFYPPCNFELVGEMEVVDAPIRAFHGAKDEWNPLPRCRDYIERLAAAGHDAQITVYPDARHAFDHTNSPAYNEMSDAQTSRTCMRREENGRLMNVATGKPFSWRDECVQLGPPVQYNDAANSQAQAAVKEFLTKLFHLN